MAPHYDLMENIGIVVAGRRRFILFPPEELKNLYVGPIELTPAGTPVSLVDPHNPETLYAGAAPVAIYRSIDGGAHWRQASRPDIADRAKMPFPCRVMRMARDPASPRHLFAAIEVNGRL